MEDDTTSFTPSFRGSYAFVHRSELAGVFGAAAVANVGVSGKLWGVSVRVVVCAGLGGGDHGKLV